MKNRDIFTERVTDILEGFTEAELAKAYPDIQKVLTNMLYGMRARIYETPSNVVNLKAFLDDLTREERMFM